ncbi:hypothetical protein UlMin_008795 [Ulmus minor]
MTGSVEPLVVGKVIGDIVDLFAPNVKMSVHFGSKHITNGCTIKPFIAIEPLKVTIGGESKELFTLIMTDPDAPSPSEPSMREFVQWIVVDIPGGKDPSKGREILSYYAPTPKVGIHRYALVLFKQKEALGEVEKPEKRANFRTRIFAETHGLGLPVATTYFNAQKEPQKKKK